MECALDADKFVSKVLTDFSKAFDCIPHGLLIAKMKAYDLRIHISNEKRSWMPLLKGIPQE